MAASLRPAPAAAEGSGTRGADDGSAPRRRPPGAAQPAATLHPEWPTQDLYVRFRKQIAPEVEANMLAIPRKQRAMVRKGLKNNLRSEIDRDIEPVLRPLCRQRPPARDSAFSPALFRGPATEVFAAIARC
jgi:hypothetical protein